MTITRRNRLIRGISAIIAELDGGDALDQHIAEADSHSSLCCSHVYDDAARNTYAHLSGRRVYRSPSGRAYLPIGLPALQQMLGAWS